MSRREKIEQMLEKQPDDPFLNYGLAMEFIKQGEIEPALARFDRTVLLDPDYVAAYFHKGNALAGCGRIDDACAALHAGIQAARRKGDAHAEGELQGLLDSLI